jgi:glycosyltransferase involved in cell wall biosynthesis
MKILLNGLGYDSGKSGISVYIKEVAQEFDSRRKDEVLLFVNESDKEAFDHLDYVKMIVIPRFFAKPIFSVLFSLFILPFWVKSLHADIFILLAANRRLCSFYPCKTVAVMHDLSQFHIEKKYDVLRLFYVKKIIPIFLTRCNQIQCISKSTLTDVHKILNFPLTKLKVNHLGFRGEVLEKREHSKRNTLLYVSRIESPGKNHLELLRAYALYSEDFKSKHPLIFVGALWSGHETVLEEIETLGLANYVSVRGHVSKDELNVQYQKAMLFILPSLYEGFGIPLLEAMKNNVPIACSNISSLPEIGADAVLTFDPGDKHDIFNTMNEIISNAELSKSLVKRGRMRIKDFCWERHVESLLSI